MDDRKVLDRIEDAYSGMPITDSNEEVVSLNIANTSIKHDYQDTGTVVNQQQAQKQQQDSTEKAANSIRSETAEMNENILQFIKQNNIQTTVD